MSPGESAGLGSLNNLSSTNLANIHRPMEKKETLRIEPFYGNARN